MRKEGAEVSKDNFLDEHGLNRDLWPLVPTRTECTAVGFPTDFEHYDRLTRLWPALSIDEKARLGFKQVTRAMEIERMIAGVEARRKEGANAH